MLLESSIYPDDDSVVRFHRRAIEELEALPGAVAAATVDYLPLNHETNVQEFEVVGQAPPQAPWQAVLFAVSPGYFQVMDIPLLSGRDFAGDEDASTERVAIVDATFVDRHFGDRDALGEMLRLSEGVTARIIGVVGAARQVDLADSPPPVLYLSQLQAPRRYMRVLARTATDPASLVPAVRAAMAGLEPRLPLAQVRTISQVVEEFLQAQSTLANGLALLAAGALLLAAVGVYGLMAFFVSQRVRDIGIHVALGATRGRVGRMIASRVLRLTAVGVAIGVVIAYGTMQALGSFLYGVRAADPMAYGVAAAFLALVAVGAGLVGARQALAIDPMTVLRDG